VSERLQLLGRRAEDVEGFCCSSGCTTGTVWTMRRRQGRPGHDRRQPSQACGHVLVTGLRKRARRPLPCPRLRPEHDLGVRRGSSAWSSSPVDPGLEPAGPLSTVVLDVQRGEPERAMRCARRARGRAASVELDARRARCRVGLHPRRRQSPGCGGLRPWNLEAVEQRFGCDPVVRQPLLGGTQRSSLPNETSPQSGSRAAASS